MDPKKMEEFEIAVKEAELRASQAQTQNMQQQLVMEPEPEKSMIQQQLDLGDELERIDYLLRGYSLEHNDQTGMTSWKKPTNTEMIILSEYGVHLIRNTIAWYLNKNTLLSNYDEATINTKMEDFANDLNDTVFMEYEKVFQYPTLKDCKDILDQRIQKKKELRVYALKLMSKVVNEKEIEDKILKEVEPVIERELEKIKEQVIKNKLKRFLIIIREVQDAVHSTYLRAWKGQERTTLRQHIHISETKGGYSMPPNQQANGPMGWLKR